MPVDVFTWMRAAVIPALYYTQTYADSATSSYDARFIDNQVGFRLGPPRLRQLRIKNGTMYLHSH